MAFSLVPKLWREKANKLNKYVLTVTADGALPEISKTGDVWLTAGVCD